MSTTDKLRGAIAPAAQQAPAAAPQKRMTSKNPIINMLLSPAFKNQMAMALPKTLTADRLTRIVMTEFRKTFSEPSFSAPPSAWSPAAPSDTATCFPTARPASSSSATAE